MIERKEIKYEIIMGHKPKEMYSHDMDQIFYKVSDEVYKVDGLAYAFPGNAGPVLVQRFIYKDEVETIQNSEHNSSFKQKFLITDLKKLILSTDSYLKLPELTQEEIDEYFEAH